jgi:hypothetical protein
MNYKNVFLIGFMALLSPPYLEAESPPTAEVAPIETFASPASAPEISNPAGFQIVSDPDTKISTFLIQTPFAEDPLLMDLLKNVRNDIRIVCIVQDTERANRLWANLVAHKLTNLSRRVRFLVSPSGHLSRWGRDPYIVLANPALKQFALVSAVNKGSKRSNNWEDRYVRSSIVASDVGQRQIINAQIDRIPTWLVDGGAITSDRTTAYLGKGTVFLCTRNENDTAVIDEAQAVQSITTVVGKKIIVLPSADLHSDRYHMPVGKTKFGERTSLLSDPVKALEILASLTPQEREAARAEMQRYGLKWDDETFANSLEGKNLMARMLAKLNKKTIDDFLNVSQDVIEKVRQSLNIDYHDEAAQILKDNGVTVIRVPVLNKNYIVKNIVGDGDQEREEIENIEFPLTLAYTNIIQDCDGKTKTVFIPKYGIKKLDDYVYNVYKSLGRFDKIIQVRSVQEAAGDGGPRCRVQVLGFPNN